MNVVRSNGGEGGGGGRVLLGGVEPPSQRSPQLAAQATIVDAGPERLFVDPSRTYRGVSSVNLPRRPREPGRRLSGA